MLNGKAALRAGRHDMVRRDVVLHFEQHFARHRILQRMPQRERLDVGPAHHLGLAVLVRRGDEIVVDEKRLGHLNLQHVFGEPRVARVGQYAIQRGHSRRLRADEIHAGARRAGTVVEVAVERAHRNGVGTRACPIPMHGPQPHSVCAPASMMSARAPFSASMVITCLSGRW